MYCARIVALVLLVGVSQACGGDNDSKNDDATKPTTKTVSLTPSGTTVQLDGATLVFPSGAVSTNQEITASIVASPPVALDGDRTFSSTIVSLLPHGLILEAPALVTLKRTASGVGTLRYVRLADEAASTWTDEGPATAVGDTVQFSLTRFSFDGVATLATTCTPSCGARVCGVDPVCSLPCGTCAVGSGCNADGACIPTTPNCTPTCNGNTCGQDTTCGVSCGQCDLTQTCVAGTCQGEACMPRTCGDAACGSNGCDGTCGAGCASGSVCSVGSCVATWSEETTPCANQPVGSVMPMTGGCAERGNRSSFSVAAGPDFTRSWSWRPPGALGFGNRSFYSPVIDDAGTIYVASLDALYAVLDEGTAARTVWRVTPTDLGDSNQGIVSAPVVVGTTVIVVTKDGKVHARNTADGSEKWTKAMGAALTYTPVQPAVLSDRILVTGNEKMFAYAVSNGNVLMERDYPDANTLDLSLKGNLLVGGNASNNQIKAYAYDSTSNDPIWYGFNGTPFRAVPVTFRENGNVVYATFDNPRVKLFDATPPSGEATQPTVKTILPPASYISVRVAMGYDDVVLMTNGGRPINPEDFASHCIFDLKLETPTCVAVTPNPQKAVLNQPLALRDGTFVIVDIAGRLILVDGEGAVLRDITLAAAVAPDVLSADTVYGSPIVGADGRIYVTYGGGGGELHAVSPTLPD